MKYSLSRFSVGADHVETARKALEKLVASVQQHDPGLVYLVFQEGRQPVFFTLVSFENDEVYRRYATSRHVAEFARAVLPLCDGKPSFVGLDLLAATRRTRPDTPAAARTAVRRNRRQRKAPVRLAANKRRRHA